MVMNIAPADCEKRDIKTYLEQLFPEVKIDDIQLAYNISSLIKAAEEYERIADARIYCEVHRNRDREPIEARTSCCTCKTVDALEYYKEEEARLAGL